MAGLRKQLIRLAHGNPGAVREAILPLLKEAQENVQGPDYSLLIAVYALLRNLIPEFEELTGEEVVTLRFPSVFAKCTGEIHRMYGGWVTSFRNMERKVSWQLPGDVAKVGRAFAMLQKLSDLLDEVAADPEDSELMPHAEQAATEAKRLALQLRKKALAPDERGVTRETRKVLERILPV